MAMTKFSRINKQREEITMRVLEDMEKGTATWKLVKYQIDPLEYAARVAAGKGKE